MATEDKEISDSRSSLYKCAGDVLQRITAIETTLKSHIAREERGQAEIKWVVRFIFASMVGIILHLAGLM